MSEIKLGIQRCPDSLIRPTIERDHYLQRWPDPRSLPFGYVLTVNGSPIAEDGRPWGIVTMKKPQHHKQSALFGYEGLPTSWQVLDLARVWVNPCLQSMTWQGRNRDGRMVTHKMCIFSRMVGMALRQVQRDWIDHHPPVYPELPYHIELIISYCDRAHHEGLGYRASGFEQIGVTRDGTKDVYVRRLRRPRWIWTDTQMKLEAII